ncbi:glycerophosphoryl diester phosphodiesterase [Neobacillus niacini]|uniref:glycerophosphodiester phosphodiesterase n=1 Tax=Neobacillus driksii TaxID=3035913 RepID=UPI002787EA15|nr:glycerophosphodiester phosphodiesterase family protein [Neobacillus niacini]MDQ0972254.1 glycerophosphoryl diester phosphodiesterase [Neobacillus niacini]
MPLCMAHRGFSGIAPENTLIAFEKALELDFVTSIELDVQLSKDGIPVIIHDFSLERTTNGFGFVKDKTFHELRELDAGSWFSNHYGGERIPSLEEVLTFLKNKGCFVNIELKTAGGQYKGYEHTIIDLVKKYDMEKTVCLTSFDHEVIKNIKNIETEIRTGLIIEGNPVLLREQLLECGATILSINVNFLTYELVERLKKDDIDIVTWTVNDAETMEKVIGISKDIYICTNFPDRYMEIVTNIINK